MRVAVVGSRHGVDASLVYTFLNELKRLVADLVIISGECPTGVDADAKRWASQYQVEYLGFPPAQKTTQEFHRRNRQLVEAADFVLAFSYQQSRGTAYTIKYAQRINKPLQIIDL